MSYITETAIILLGIATLGGLTPIIISAISHLIEVIRKNKGDKE